MKYQAQTIAPLGTSSKNNTATRVVSAELTTIFQNLVKAGLTPRESAMQLGLSLAWAEGGMLLSHY